MHLLLPHSDLISALIIRFHDFLPFCTPSFLNRRNAFSPRFDPLCTYVKTKDSNKTILCICFFLYLLTYPPTYLPIYLPSYNNKQWSHFSTKFHPSRSLSM